MKADVTNPPTKAPSGHGTPPDSFAWAAAQLDEKARPPDRRLREIGDLLRGGFAQRAYQELLRFLETHPDNVNALFLSAEALARLGRRDEAIARFALCLERDPGFAPARFGQARLLLRLKRFGAALREADRLLEEDPRNPLYLQLKANALICLGEDKQVLALWRQLSSDYPERAESWIKYGDALRASGFQQDAIAAYRRAIACSPSPGLAWWSLANLKAFRFSRTDIADMEGRLEIANITPEDRINILFALGKAHEDMGAFAQSFELYAKANAAKRLRGGYPHVPEVRLAETELFFSKAFFERRRNGACERPGPIFVVGQLRSGSTLIEQILSCHSAIEAAGELKYIPALARRFEDRARLDGALSYPHVLEALQPAELSALGEEYLADAQAHRRSGRPYFVDKDPFNYHYIGLIRLILPKAKIIDARRHPAGCCLSMFKQNLGTASLRLNELGRNYRDYVALMAHFDRVLPGRIHRVIYEQLVADPEGEIRRLLDWLGLPFEDGCLRFYENERAILTPSSEQVRRPISCEAVEAWRNFEPWLKPLLDSLGAVASDYPSVPEELLQRMQ